MTPQAKIAALRAALESVLKLPRGTSGRIIIERSDEDKLRLALTADDAEQAPDEQAAFERWMLEEAKCVVGSSDPYPAGMERLYRSLWNSARHATPAPIAAEPAPKPWRERMEAEYAREKEYVKHYLAPHFMQQEIDDWRARNMKG